jgi:hypothetical protein
MEIVSSPANGDVFLNQIEDLCRAINLSDGDTDRKCGLHIHIDCRDHSFFDVAKLVKVYFLIENELYSLLPASRRDNNYCKKCAKHHMRLLESTEGLLKRRSKKVSENRYMPKFSANAKARLVYDASGEDIKSEKASKYNHNRYFGLNLHSWIYRGSIEFRMGAGTINASKIKSWALLCNAIIEYAYSLSDKEVSDMKSLSLDTIVDTAIKIDKTKKVVLDYMADRKQKFLHVGDQ